MENCVKPCSINNTSFVFSNIKDMFRKATHITFSFLLLIVTTGFSISKQCCEPASASVNFMAVAAGHCAMPAEDCRTQITSIKIKSSFLEATHSYSLNQVNDYLPSSVVSVQPDASDEEPVVILSTFKLPKTQTVLARLQSYLL